VVDKGSGRCEKRGEADGGHAFIAITWLHVLFSEGNWMVAQAEDEQATGVARSDRTVERNADTSKLHGQIQMANSD
jgi:hypothetical protein